MLRAYIATFFSMLFWGMSFVWTKTLLNNGFPPITIITLRLVIAAIILFVVFKIAGKLDKIHKKDWKLFFLLALFEPFLYFFGENWGLQFVEPSFASVIISTIPLFVPFLLFFFYKEKLNGKLFLGIILTIIGLIFMTFDGNTANISAFLGNLHIKGIILLFLAVLSACGYSVVLYRTIKKYDAITITTYQNIIGAIYYLPVFFIFDFKDFHTLQFNFTTLYPLFSLAICCSAICFICYNFAAKKLTIPRISVFTNAIPIVTLLFSVLLGLENITLMKITGIIIVILGVYLSQIRKKSKKLNQED